MKLKRMDFRLLTSLLLLVLFILPLKSESSDDSKERENEDESDNYDGTGSGENEEENKEDESDNEYVTKTTRSVIVDKNATNGMDGMPAMTMVQAKDGGMETAQIVLKVALPVGTFVLLILLAVICFVFRRKVKGLLGQFRVSCDKRPDQSNPVYGIKGPAFANTTSDKFDILKYAMQTGQEHLQPVNIQMGVYEDLKPVPRENPNEPYDTTYQTLCGECYNTSNHHIMGSKASVMTTPLQ